MSNWYRTAQNYSWQPSYGDYDSNGEVYYMLPDLSPEGNSGEPLPDEIKGPVLQWIQQTATQLGKQITEYDSINIQYSYKTNTYTEHIQHGVHSTSVGDAESQLEDCSGTLYLDGGNHDVPVPQEICEMILEWQEEKLTEY